MIFENENTGAKKDIVFRDFRADDGVLIVEAVRRTYGDTYARKDFYVPEKIAALVSAGKVYIRVAETTDGEYVGVIAGIVSPLFSSSCEGAAQIIEPAFRGYGISVRQCEDLFSIIADSGVFSSIFGHAVTYNLRSQHNLEHIGFMPCGFILNDIPSFSEQFGFASENKRASFAVVSKPLKRRKITLYADKELLAPVKYIYNGLNQKIKIKSDFKKLRNKRTVFSDVTENGSVSVFVGKCGQDFRSVVNKISDKARQSGYVVNIFLAMNDRTAVAAERILLRDGYIFTGVHPLNSSGEFLIFNNSFDLVYKTDELMCVNSQRRILGYIERKRKNGKARN